MYHIHSSIWAAMISTLLLFTSLDASGNDFKSGGIYYNINADGEVRIGDINVIAHHIPEGQ